MRHLRDEAIEIAVKIERSGDSIVASIVAAVLGTLAMSLVSAVIVRIAIAQFAGGFWELVRVDLRTSTWVFALNGLLGGLTVQVRDQLLDASIRGRLERLRDQLHAGARLR